MMQRTLFFLHSLLVVSVFILTAQSLDAEVFFVEGWEKTVYNYGSEASASFHIPNYANKIFQQQVQQGDDGSIKIIVTVDVKVLPHVSYPRRIHKKGWNSWNNKGTSVNFHPSGEAIAPLIVLFSHAISTQADSYASLGFKIQNWISSRFRTHDESVVSRNAAALLYRGWGNCVDLSNLAVRMFQAAGIEARIVHGLYFQAIKGQETGEDALQEATFHRWIEFRIPGKGWYFYDPTYSYGFVPSRYVVLFIDGSDLPFPPSLSLFDLKSTVEKIFPLEQDIRLFSTDCMVTQSAGFYSARIHVNQYSSAIFGSLLTNMADQKSIFSDLIVYLAQNREVISTSTVTTNGDYSFTCLEPGRYSIIIHDQRVTTEAAAIEIQKGESKRVDILLYDQSQ